MSTFSSKNTKMLGDSTYNYKDSEDFAIENGVLKGVARPPTIDHNNYGELILSRMREQPDFVGQIDGVTGRKETFADMTERSVKCAMWLKKQNVKIGDVIGICTHNQVDMYVPCFASLYAGAIFNPWWDSGLTTEVAKHFVTLTKPKVFFANEASTALVAEVAKEIGIEMKIVVFGKLPGFQSLEEILETQDDKLVFTFSCTKLSSSDEPAIIQYTSGSTGLPKGVLRSHKSLMGRMNIKKPRDTNGPVTALAFSPLSWATAIIIMFDGIFEPETRIIYPEFQEETVFQLIQKFKVNWMLVGTSLSVRLQKSPLLSKYDLSSLKRIVVTGGALKEATQKAMAKCFPRTIINQAYGTTELGCITLEMEATGTKYGSSGRIIPNFSMKVIDTETGQILGPNQSGEACFKSPYLMTGYYNNPNATNEIFDAEGWLHTGDLVYYDEEGYVFIIDRIKELIKYRGYHVSPSMVERVLLTHPEVTEAAVFAIPHDVDDEHPFAFVVTIPKAKVTKAELQNLVADALPDCMKLRGGVKFINELPHTSSGKIARSELRKLAKSYAKA